MSKFGKHVIESLRDALARMRRGEPFKQTIVRRMKVKGETVYTHETFNAPIGKTGGPDARE